MKLFNSSGVMIIPVPEKHPFKEHKKILVVKECFCPNGHNLVSDRANFNDHKGIELKAEKSDGSTGTIFLSPVYGEKCRVALDIDLQDGEILKLFCPTCGVELPTYSSCSACGDGQLIALFSTKEADFADAIGICNKVGCPNSEIMSGSELLTFTMIDAQ